MAWSTRKGGWTLHMLRGRLGTETFWAGIRDYYRRYRDGNVSTDDFRRVMEETSGQDLGWFFQQWLRRPGSPEVNGTWQYRPEDHCIDIELTQTQPGDPVSIRRSRSASTVEGSAAPRIEKIEMTERRHRFSIQADKAPTSVILDPNCWVLMKSSFAPRSEREDKENLGASPCGLDPSHPG